MADDLGRDNLGAMNDGATSTPHIDDLIKNGLFLEDFHTFKICGPSRASTMTGRYPFNVGFYGDGQDQHISNFTAYPELLQRVGYSTHAIGKWDVGYVVDEMTPTYKGFDTFLGYYRACNNDLFYHSTGGCPQHPTNGSKTPTDMSRNVGKKIGPAEGLNGTYSTRAFSKEAVSIIGNRDPADSLYMYIAPQNVHLACGTIDFKYKAGIQAPCETADKYKNVVNDTFKAQSAVTTELDYLVGNVTRALKDSGHWEDTILVFTSDNGGPLDHTTNWPLKGGKHTFWDGGVRVVAFISGGALPASRRGQRYSGIAHSSDWYSTLVEGVAGSSIPVDTGPLPPDSINIWNSLVNSGEPERSEVIHQVKNKHFTEDVEAIRVGDLKFIRGPNVGDDRTLKWPSTTSVSSTFGSTGGIRREGNECLAGTNQAKSVKNKTICADPGCLFNITADPGESHNVIFDPRFASAVATMKAKLDAAGAAAPPQNSYFQDPTSALDAICKVESDTGFLEPLRFGSLGRQ